MWRLLTNFLKRFSEREDPPGALATIENIPTEQFNALVDALCAEGWRKTYEYDGFDAWIDYGHVTLRKGRQKLTFEWTNWFEGTIKGAPGSIEPIAEAHGLTITEFSPDDASDDAP